MELLIIRNSNRVIFKRKYYAKLFDGKSGRQRNLKVKVNSIRYTMGAQKSAPAKPQPKKVELSYQKEDVYEEIEPVNQELYEETF